MGATARSEEPGSTTSVEISLGLRNRLTGWITQNQADDLDGLVADEQARAAADSRSRSRALMQQAVEGASFAGVLLDAAERFLRVELHLVGGRVLRGPITAVGADFCALLTHAVPAHYVATGAVAQIRVEARSLAATGDRDNAYERTMEQVVRELAATRTRVGVVVAGSNDVLSGELRSCGLDVCTLVFDLGVATRRPARDGSGRPVSDPECQVAHIRLSAIDELMAYEF